MLRSEKVQECVRKYTEEILYDGRIDAEGIDASTVSLMTKIGRTNVSKELNSLWKNGQLIKLQGRPVFFLDYLTIKKEYPAQYIPLLIPQGSKISDYLKTDGPKEMPEPIDKNPLDNIIGYRDGTLSRMVDDVVAAISYKGKSIPVLIEGDRGIRKRNFVSSVFEYARLNGLKGEDARLIFINCQEYTEAEDRFLARILGNNEEKGAFELANKGIIYFQNIHYLSYACIAPIVDAITFGYYSKVGEIRRRKLEVSIVASVNDTADQEKMRYLHSNFPMIAKIPAYERRNIFERIETLLYMFSTEAKSLNINILINKSILSLFLQYHYDENDRQIHNYIRFTCANAYNRQRTTLENTLHIEVDNLPLDLLSGRYDEEKDSAYVSSLGLYSKNYILCERDGRCECLDFYRKIQKTANAKNLDDFVEQFSLSKKGSESIEAYISDMVEVLLGCDETHYQHLRSAISDEVRLCFLKELYSDPYYQALFDAERVLYGAMAIVSDHLKSKSARGTLPDPNLFEDKEHKSSAAICRKLSISDPEIFSFIAAFLSKALKQLTRSNVALLAVAKGESIASQYKTLCKSYAAQKSVRIDSVDYRSDIQYNDILELIGTAAARLNSHTGVILLVDSYPLNDIETYIRDHYEIKCKVISPLSYESFVRAIDCASASYTIDDFIDRYGSPKSHVQNEPAKEDFIKEFTDQVLSKTLTHINPAKAVEVLQISLDNILDELKIIKTQDILVKYLSHGAHMLERVIKKQPLDYYRLKRFTNQNHDLMDIIAKSLTPAENMFDLSVPSSEIAYLAEIFLEGA